MMNISEVPYLTIFRQRVNLPLEGTTFFGNMVFLNMKSIDAFGNLMLHNQIKHRKYRFYYYPFRFKGRIITKAYNLNLKNRRKDEYTKISNMVSDIKPMMMYETLKGRNVFIDLRIYNEIFFSRVRDKQFEITLRKYIEYLKSTMDSFKGYNTKIMMVDVNDWHASMSDFKTKKDALLNPVFMTYYLLRKYPDIYKKLGDIDIIFYTQDRLMKINPSKTDKTTHTNFKFLMNKLSKGILPEEDTETDKVIDETDLKSGVISALKDQHSKALIGSIQLSEKKIAKSSNNTAGERLANFVIDMEGTLEYTQNTIPNEGLPSSEKGKYGIRDNVEGGYADCISFVTYAYQKELGIDIGDIDDILVRGEVVEDGYNKTNKEFFGNKSIVKKLKPGDVIIYNSNGDNDIMHLEVYVGNMIMYGHGSLKRKGPSPHEALHDHPRTIKEVRRYVDDYGNPINCPTFPDFSIKVKKKSFSGEDEEQDIELNEDGEIIDNNSDMESDTVEEVISSEVEKIIEDKVDEFSEEELLNTDQTVKEIMSDKQFISQIYEKNKNIDESKLNPRDRKLRENFRNIKIDGQDINELYTKAKDVSKKKFTGRKINKQLHTINKNMEEVRYPDFDKLYIDNVMDKDYTDAFKSLTEKSIGMNIVSIDKKDSSNELTYKETWTVVIEDEYRLRHKIVVDVPKIIDNRYFYIDGNKKILYKQKFPHPVIKIGPDVVQVATNYKKIFIYRYGRSITQNIEKFNFAIFNTDEKGLFVERGNNRSINSKYITTFEYDELSTKVTLIENKVFKLYFNIKNMLDDNPTYEMAVADETILPIGYMKDSKRTRIDLDVNSQKIVGTELGLIDFIMSNLDSKTQEVYNAAKSGTRFIHSRVFIMKKYIPLALILAYAESFSGLLRKASIQHRFSDKRPNDVSNDERVLRFSDGYFIYKSPTFATELLMNGFTSFNTRAFTYEAFDNRDTYIDILHEEYGSRILGNALENFYECLIDPKTKEILEYLNYPTDFTSVLLYGNELLSDNNHIPEDDMSQFRIRSFEMLPGMLYSGLSTAYGTYKITANNNNPVKMSLPQDYLIKQILALPTLENYSEINPMAELEKNRDITPKGHTGLNTDRAYTLDKRTYHSSMKGIYSLVTATDKNTGVRRTLSLEPNINNIYGMVDSKEDKDLKDVNLFSPAELASPLGASMDDSSRTSMAINQSKHAIPVQKGSPVIISNGIEETMPYYLSKDFSIIAEEDGHIVEVKEDIAIAKYKSGKVQAIDLRPRMAKNSGGGFYLANKYKMDLKKGQKFSKDDILAYDDKFFTGNKHTGVRFNIGSLQKIAIAATDMTIEDSAEITREMAKDMMSEITIKIPITLSKTTNVEYLCSKNQEVKTGDELLRFDIATDDADISKLLVNIGEDLQEEIISLSKNKIKSKVSGKIVDIKMYTTVDIEELSPSLQKIFNSYNRELKSFNNTIEKELSKEEKLSDSPYKAGLYSTEKIGKITPNSKGKVKGEEVGEGVLIEIYTTYEDFMAVGDKGSFFTALKFEVSNVVPEGYEPYTLNRPNESIGSMVGPSAIIARKTPSIEITLAGNKAAVELKRKLWEIYYDKDWNSKH